MRFLLFMLTVISLAPAPLCATGEGESVFGVWLTEGGASKLEIAPCGDNACARVVWMKNSTYMNSKDGPVGTEKTDRHNPDPDRRNRPILGLQVMEGLMPDGEWWKKGSCYDPQTGKNYQCKMKLESPTELKLIGFIGFSLLGRSYTLTMELSGVVTTPPNRESKVIFP
jgi:uncharacterized protein (DUF2147 family)